MNRRAFIETLGISVPLAGCSFRSETPDFNVNSPTVKPGETATLEVQAENVWDMQISSLPGSYFDIGSAEFSDPPDTIWLANSPTWQWSPSENIRADIPIIAKANAQKGKHEFSVSIQQGEDRERRSQQSEVTVDEERD